MIRRKPEYEYQWLPTGKAAKQPSMIIRPLPQDIQAILKKNFGGQNHLQQQGSVNNGGLHDSPQTRNRILMAFHRQGR